MEPHEHDDQSLLIDFLLGQCDRQTTEALRRRLDEEPALHEHCQNLRHALAAADLLAAVEPPEDLVDSTLHRIRQHEHTNALLAREQLARTARRPTFSLRELTAVAAVVLVLFGVFAIWRHEARRKELAVLCAGRMGQIGTGLRTYANAHGGYLPSADASAGWWLPSQARSAVSNSSGLFKLVVAGYVPPSTFQCPGVEGDSASPVYAVRAGMTDFPEARHISFSYQHSIGGRRLSQKHLAAVARQMAILADSSPLFENSRFLRELLRRTTHQELTSRNHGTAGQNVLYLDGTVAWRESPLAGVDGDNIYLAGDIVDYRGNETPTTGTDSFLLPDYCRTTLMRQ